MLKVIGAAGASGSCASAGRAADVKVYWGNPGKIDSVIVFSDRLVHGSTRNTAGKDRYAIISTYHSPGADEPFDLDFPARKVLVGAA